MRRLGLVAQFGGVLVALSRMSGAAAGVCARARFLADAGVRLAVTQVARLLSRLDPGVFQRFVGAHPFVGVPPGKNDLLINSA